MSARRTSRRDDALRWSPLAELAVDRNETPVSSRIARLTKFGELIQTYIGDTRAAGRPPQRSRTAILDLQQRESGIVGINALERKRLIQFDCARPEAGAGPVTPGIDVGMRHSRAGQCAAAPGFGPNSAVPPPGRAAQIDRQVGRSRRCHPPLRRFAQHLDANLQLDVVFGLRGRSASGFPGVRW